MDSETKLAILESKHKILQVKYDRLYQVFEEVLKQNMTLAELRDFWRSRAGVETKLDGEIYITRKGERIDES